jgi:hypothetical protein
MRKEKLFGGRTVFFSLLHISLGYNPKGGGALNATSEIPVAYDIFEVKTVAIANTDLTRYAHPVNGKIVIDQLTPYTFYLLRNEGTGETYLETSEWQFVDAHNNAEDCPITYVQTAIDTKNFRITVVPVNKDECIFSFKVEAAGNRYINWNSSAAGDFLYCNATDNKGITAQFKIIPPH